MLDTVAHGPDRPVGRVGSGRVGSVFTKIGLSSGGAVFQIIFYFLFFGVE